MTTTSTSIAPCDMHAIDKTIAATHVAIASARSRRKAELRDVALEVLAGDRELPHDIADLEGLLGELHELQIVAEYAELKSTLYSSPSRVAMLHAEWESRQAELEKVRAEYYAAASESRLPHHEHWDCCEADCERVVRDAVAALHAASEACAHEMTRAGEARIRCNVIEREYRHLLFEYAE